MVENVAYAVILMVNVDTFSVCILDLILMKERISFADWPEPRPNEYGGKYGRGVIVRKYTPGSEITIRILLTTSHMGY